MASVSVVQVSQEKQEGKVVSPKLPEKVVHEKREPGKVKFYHRLKRYGVIIADQDETEFLMLRSELKFYQSYGLEEGERVEFVAGVGREGKNMAFEVTRGPICFTCGKEGHIARYCRRATQPKRNQREGNGRGSVSGKGGCFRCGKPGHVQRDCQEEPRAVTGDGGGGATERVCYNCGKPGHNKNECTEPRQVASSSSTGSCYNCGQTGHLKRDCAEPPRATATSEGGGSCYCCGQTGHFKRDCPSNEQPTN